MVRYGMVVDTTLCTGCKTCIVACQLNGALRPGVSWTRVEELEWGGWPNTQRAYLPRLCMSCLEPLCVKVCPTGASFQRENGTVGIAYEHCIGCGVCIAACRYGARSINNSDSWFYGSAEPAPYEEGSRERRGVAEKCTFCHERLAEGLAPFCVENCITRARVCGNLDDENDPLHALIKQTGAHQLDETSLYYVTGNYPPDILEHVRVAGDLAENPLMQDEEKGEGNAAVLAGTGVGLGACALSVALAAKRSRSNRERGHEREYKRKQPSEDPENT